jgi:predicted RNA-binding protein with PIN domain
MPYLIDGHNVIGRMGAVSLADPDDEAVLEAHVRRLCARERTTATIYFDGAVVASTRGPARGGVASRFVAAPQTADAAIARALARLGREAPNWTVVSSDQAVAEAARRCGARVESSAAFARRLEAGPPGKAPPEKPEAPSTEADIAAWEAAFKKRRRPAGRG